MANYNATIYASADTYVDTLYSGVNFGTSSTLKVHQYKASMFGFDISGIPADKVITNIEFYFRVNGFTSEGDPSLASNTGYNYVIKARRLSGYTLPEIESNVTFNKIWGDGTPENLLRTNNYGYDSSLNITTYYGQWASMNIANVERPENNQIIVGIRQDSSYLSSSLKMQVCYANINSRETAYAPYIVVYYSDPAPQPPTDLVPNNTVRNRLGEIVLSWQNSTIQTAYSLQYSTNNFTTTTTLTGTTSNNRTIPANTFTNGATVKWRVQITDNLASQSNWSEVASFTIGATVPSTPILLSPVNTVTNSSDEIYYKWRFMDSFGYTQAKYDLQYKKSGMVETLISNTSTNPLYIMPPNIITGGNYEWRVRCYNAFDEVSPYTDWATFYSIGKPETPTILSVSNNTHPKINWSSVEQNLFNVKIYNGSVLVHDSGEEVIQELNEYTVSDFLDNGNYILKLSVSNLYGLWSNEATYNFTINTTKPIKPTLAGSSADNYVVALIADSLETTNLIYTKGNKDTEFKLIATLTGGANTYIDYLASYGINEYFVRAVSADSFNDSDIIIININFKGIILNCTDNYDNMFNLWETLNSDIRPSIGLTNDQYLIFYNGKKYATLQSTEFTTYTESHSYVISPSDYNKVFNLINCNSLIYRNNKGDKYKVALTNKSLAETELNLYVVTFVLTRLEG